MANTLYSAGKAAFMKKQINIDTGGDVIVAALVKNTYTFDDAHSNFTTHIGSASAGTQTLSGQSIASGTSIFDANDVTFPAVASGSTINAVVLYHQTSGTLLAYIDSGAGLPITTSGADITINWSNATNKIFKL